MPLSDGQTICNGKYEILRLIGEGGQSRVWLAREVERDLLVAVKEPLPALSPVERQEVEQRFQREILLSARSFALELPNIVRVLTVEQHSDETLLVMEYCPGGSLAHRLTQGPLPIAEATHIALDLCRALDAVHERLRLVHRNIKPSKILFAADGHVKLTGFGLAQTTESGRSRLAAAGHPGTPGYMSREQENATGYLPPSSDLYSLGCVLFEMLTGFAYQRQEPGTRASALRAEVPAWVDNALAVLLREDPWERYGTAREMAAALGADWAHRETDNSVARPEGLVRPRRSLTRLWFVAIGLVTVAFVTVWRGRNGSRGFLQVMRPERGVASVAPAPTVWSAPAATESLMPETVATRVLDRDGSVVVYVPSASFLMGSSQSVGGAGDSEQPQHEVYLDGFWIGRTEVTRGQYRSFIDGGGYSDSTYWSDEGWRWKQQNGIAGPRDWRGESTDLDYHPVGGVSWYEASAYAKWAGARLPTEAEWEKAARGIDGRIYPWGGGVDGTRMNYCDRNCGIGMGVDMNTDDGFGGTAPVGYYPMGASPYGALDMAGNVSEWVADWFDGAYYREPHQLNPVGPPTGTERVFRGGEYDWWYFMARSACRCSDEPDSRDTARGFRLAL